MSLRLADLLLFVGTRQRLCHRPHADVKAGELAFNQVQRKICVLSLNADFGAELFVPPKDGFLSSDLGIAIDFPNKVREFGFGLFY